MMVNPRRTFQVRGTARMLAPLVVLAIVTWSYLQSRSSERPYRNVEPSTNFNEARSDFIREEWASASREFLAVTDGTLELAAEEMPAYWRQLGWVKQHSFADMSRKARTEFAFDSFVQRPSELRGELVQVDLNVRRILSYKISDNPLGVNQLFEIWGWSDESPNCLYVGVATELPSGMQVGAIVHERARFCGYLLKLQGYLPSGADSRSAPLAAPLLIGRLVRSNAPAAVVVSRGEWWRIGAGVILAISFAGSLASFTRRRKPTQISVPHRECDDSSLLDEWLNHGETRQIESPPADETTVPKSADANQLSSVSQGNSLL